MANKKQRIEQEQDAATAFLISVGVDKAKAEALPKNLGGLNINSENPFAFIGSDYRPDLVRYSVVDNDLQQRDLERKGFVRLPDSADVHQIGVSGGRIMARPKALDDKAKEERARRDYNRRNSKNVRSGEVLDNKNGARFDITSNYTPATATEGGY